MNIMYMINVLKAHDFFDFDGDILNEILLSKFPTPESLIRDSRLPLVHVKDTEKSKYEHKDFEIERLMTKITISKLDKDFNNLSEEAKDIYSALANMLKKEIDCELEEAFLKLKASNFNYFTAKGGYLDHPKGLNFMRVIREYDFK